MGTWKVGRHALTDDGRHMWKASHELSYEFAIRLPLTAEEFCFTRTEKRETGKKGSGEKREREESFRRAGEKKREVPSGKEACKVFRWLADRPI